MPKFNQEASPSFATALQARHGTQAQAATRSMGRAGQGATPIVITVVLCEDELYKTDGSNTVWLTDIYDVPSLRALGPMIKGIRAHYVCEGATTLFTAKISTVWSVTGKTWSSATDILAATSGNNTGVMSSWLTTDSVFGLQMRYAIEVKNSSGGAIESGRVTAILEVELKS